VSAYLVFYECLLHILILSLAAFFTSFISYLDLFILTTLIYSAELLTDFSYTNFTVCYRDALDRHHVPMNIIFSNKLSASCICLFPFVLFYNFFILIYPTEIHCTCLWLISIGIKVHYSFNVNWTLFVIYFDILKFYSVTDSYISAVNWQGVLYRNAKRSTDNNDHIKAW